LRLLALGAVEEPPAKPLAAPLPFPTSCAAMARVGAIYLILIAHRDNVGKKRKVGGSSIAELEKSQRRLWNIALVLCIIIFFVLSIWWIGIELGAFARPGRQAEELMEMADLAAIFVFAIEFYSRYRKTPDKLVFLKKNWLGIIAILPIGMFFRLFRGLEGAGAFRSAELALKVEREGMVLPELAIAGRAVAHVLEGTQKWLMHFSVVSDFFALASETAGSALKIAGNIFK